MKIKFTESNPARVKVLSATLAGLIVLAVILEFMLF